MSATYHESDGVQGGFVLAFSDVTLELTVNEAL
jgi:hypothetical protein